MTLIPNRKTEIFQKLQITVLFYMFETLKTNPVNSNRRTIVIAIMLIIAIGNYTRIIEHGTIRAVEFLSIFVIGALTSLLIREVATIIKGK